MSDDFRDQAKRDVRFAHGVGVRLVEQALAMRCRSYLAQVKAQLLTNTILEIDQRKKVLSNINTRLEREVTVRKAAERRLQGALERAEAAVRAKAQLLAMVSHDLKGPLTAMTINLRLLAEAPELNSSSRELVGELLAAEERMCGLVQGLLTTRETSAGFLARRVSVELNELVALVLRDHGVQARVKQVELVNEVPHGHRISADEQLLREGLDNLVSNAVKYSRHGGSVRVVACAPDTVTVVDGGVGLSAERQNQLLAGATAESTDGTDGERGTGLGFRLVRAVAEAHGGSVEIDSALGQGCRVTLRLGPKSD